ncbi:MAG: serine/threonine-protein phosphatase [Anaerolineae bacterium]|nr:serine/threonine-protein phosphatase [Anaerolineae bacterium]
MHLSFAASKVNKWAARESGDTLEMIERPHGGISFVLVDGQSSGYAAKSLSTQVVRKVISDLAEGVRDGAAARAANDMLYARRSGRVSATLIILSVELDSQTLLVTRCGNSPVFIRRPGEDVLELVADAPPLGFYRHTRPLVEHVELVPGLLAVACTDGLVHAGGQSDRQLDIPEAIEALWQLLPSAKAVADGLLEQALAADDGRAGDDTSVIALHVQSGPPEGPRRMTVEMPVPDR